MTYRSAAQWHYLLTHPGLRATEELPGSIEDADLDDSKAISTIDCETCLSNKAKAVISRQSEKYREANV